MLSLLILTVLTQNNPAPAAATAMTWRANFGGYEK